MRPRNSLSDDRMWMLKDFGMKMVRLPSMPSLLCIAEGLVASLAQEFVPDKERVPGTGTSEIEDEIGRHLRE